MYCVKCRRVTETGNSTNVTYKNGRLMRRGQCITCGETKTQFVKRGAAGRSFRNTFVNNLTSKCIYQDITLQVREQNSIKD